MPQSKAISYTSAGHPGILLKGNVEKSRQRRSRNFAVLTYWPYAPRVKIAAALLDDFFDHSRRVLTVNSSRTNTGFLREIFNSP